MTGGKNSRFIMPAVMAVSIVIFLAITFKGVSMLNARGQELVKLKQQSQSSDDHLMSLRQSQKVVQKYSYFNDLAKTVVPTDKDQAQAVSDIIHIANQSNIYLQGVTFEGTSTLDKASTTTGSASINAKTASPTVALSQAKPVKGISGLYSLPLTVSILSGAGIPLSQQTSFPKLIDFLSRLEPNRRTAQIAQIVISPLKDQYAGYLNVKLTVNVFLKP